MTVLYAAVGPAMASLFIRKYRTRVLHTSYFESGPYDRENQASVQRLPGEDLCSTKHPLYYGDSAALSRKLTHLLIAVVREGDLSCQTYGDDYPASSPSCSVEVWIFSVVYRFSLSIFPSQHFSFLTSL